jgi:hypothetical protein
MAVVTMKSSATGSVTNTATLPSEQLQLSLASAAERTAFRYDERALSFGQAEVHPAFRSVRRRRTKAGERRRNA